MIRSTLCVAAAVALAAASPTLAAGSIPNGTYECYSATTAKFIAGQQAAVYNPGQWHGRIVIAGQTYRYGDSGPPGRYRMDVNGTLHWMGGAYKEGDTLGRYALINGTPTIAIGWPGVDVGNACTRH